MTEKHSIHIRKGRLVDPANGIDSITDLYLEAGKVAAIGEAPDGFTAEQTIEAENLVVCPGLVDIGTALREPGYEQENYT